MSVEILYPKAIGVYITSPKEAPISLQNYQKEFWSLLEKKSKKKNLQRGEVRLHAYCELCQGSFEVVNDRVLMLSVKGERLFNVPDRGMVFFGITCPVHDETWRIQGASRIRTGVAGLIRRSESDLDNIDFNK